MTGQTQQLKDEAPAGMEQLRQLTKAITRPLIASDGGAAAEQPTLSFRGLLRQLRTQARLTQEELAEAARLSPRSVSDLERGISRTARKDTAGRLAEALNLTGPQREMFVAAARGRAPAAEVLAARGSAAPGAFAAAATGRLPRDFADSTGSIGHRAELEHLLRALTQAVTDGVVVVVIHLETPARIPRAAASMARTVTTSP